MVNFAIQFTRRPLISGAVGMYIAGLFFLGQRGGHKPLIAHIVLAIGCLMIVKVATGRLRINDVIKRYLYLTALGFLSLLWAYDIMLGCIVSAKMLIVLCGLVIMWNFIDSPEDVLSVAKLFCIGAALLFSYNIYHKDYYDLEFAYGGINTLGPLAFAVFVIGMYLVLSKCYLFVLLLPLCIYVIIISSSQKSAIGLILWSMLVSIFYIIVRGSIKHKFINIIIIIILGLGAWEVINMPLLEKTGGRTLTRILNTGANIGVFDESFFTGEDPTGGRDVFFMDGIRYFIKSPIWGHGINNYRILNGQDTGIYTYSHNTFIELLVGVGPLGIILFYSLFYMLGKMLINSQIENSIKVQFGSFFLIYLFFIGMGQEVTFDPSLFMVVTLAMGEINFGNIRNKNIPEFL